MRRLSLILLVVLAVLLVGAAGGWYLLHDESFLKSRLASLSLKTTGRALAISGPVKLELGRVTTLTASGIQFANAEWADPPDMVTIGHIEISFQVSSLLDDRPVFPLLSLQDCRVDLLKNDEERANWDLFRRKDQGPEPESGHPPRKDLPFRLSNLEINNCELVLASPDLEQPLDVKASALSMQHHDDNRWEGKGSGAVNDMAFSFEGWLSPFSAIFLGGPLTHELAATVGDISLRSSGSLQDAATWSGANITTRVQGPDIADILEEFKLPLFSEGAFDYRMKLNTEGQMTRVDLDGDLGTVDISAKGELDRLVKPTAGNLQFSVNGPNLGALAKLFGLDGLVEDSFTHETHASFESGGIRIDKAALKTERDVLEIDGHFSTAAGYAGTTLNVHFQSDEAGRWTTLFGQPQQALGPLDLTGTLGSDAKGLLSVKASAIQGKTTLNANGTLGHLPGALQPDLELVFASPDPSHLAAVFGLKKIPAAPLAVNGHFGLQGRQLRLGKVNIDLAGDQASVNGMINLENRYAGSDLSLDLDIKNTAILGRLFGKDGFPDQPMILTATVKPAGQGLSLRVKNGSLGKIRLNLDGQIPDLQKPLFMTGNFDISLPRLSDISFLYPERKLPDEPFAASGKIESQGQQLQLQNIEVKLAGSQATLHGVLNLENGYAGSDLNIHLDIENAGALARSFGHDGIPDQPLVLDAEVKPAGKGMTFTIRDGNLGDIQLDLQGQVADLANPTGVNARFDIHLPRLSDVSFLVPGRDFPEVPFKAVGKLLNEQSKTRLEGVQLEVGDVTATIDGDLFPQGRFQLSIKAAGKDVSDLAKVFGQTLNPEPFSLSTQVAGTASEFSLSGLELALGDSSAAGDLKISTGDVTAISGKIDAPRFDISQWQARKVAERETAERETAQRAEVQTSIRKWVFDDRPVMDIVDLRYTLDLDLQIEVLQLDNARVDDLNLGLVLTHNLLEISPFTMKGSHGGVFRGEARLDDRGEKPVFHLDVHSKNMRLGLTSVPGQDPSTFPPLDLDLLIDGTGWTRREMASSVDGKLRAYSGSGLVAEAGMGFFFNDFFTNLFTILNPFAKTSKYTTLDCAVTAAEAVSGKVDVFPVILNTEQLTILSQGTIDLNTEKIDLSFNTKARKGLGISAGALINPLIKVGGTLAAPAMELDPVGTVASTGLAVATVGISVLAKSMSNRFLSSADPCGEARKEIAERDSADS